MKYILVSGGKQVESLILIHLSDLGIGVVSGVGKGIIGKHPPKKAESFSQKRTYHAKKHLVPACFSRQWV